MGQRGGISTALTRVWLQLCSGRNGLAEGAAGGVEVAGAGGKQRGSQPPRRGAPSKFKDCKIRRQMTKRRMVPTQGMEAAAMKAAQAGAEWDLRS